MQKIQDEYAHRRLIVEPGDRIHRIVALLFDTWIDDLTDERIAELEQMIERFRWMDASGERVDRG